MHVSALVCDIAKLKIVVLRDWSLTRKNLIQPPPFPKTNTELHKCARTRLKSYNEVGTVRTGSQVPVSWSFCLTTLLPFLTPLLQKFVVVFLAHLLSIIIKSWVLSSIQPSAQAWASLQRQPRQVDPLCRETFALGCWSVHGDNLTIAALWRESRQTLLRKTQRMQKTKIDLGFPF